MTTLPNIISKVFPKHVLKENTSALEIYRNYKKVADIIERSSGKRPIFKRLTTTPTYLNFTDAHILEGYSGKW